MRSGRREGVQGGREGDRTSGGKEVGMISKAKRESSQAEGLCTHSYLTIAHSLLSTQSLSLLLSLSPPSLAFALSYFLALPVPPSYLFTADRVYPSTLTGLHSFAAQYRHFSKRSEEPCHTRTCWREHWTSCRAPQRERLCNLRSCLQELEGYLFPSPMGNTQTSQESNAIVWSGSPPR